MFRNEHTATCKAKEKKKWSMIVKIYILNTCAPFSCNRYWLFSTFIIIFYKQLLIFHLSLSTNIQCLNKLLSENINNLIFQLREFLKEIYYKSFPTAFWMEKSHKWLSYLTQVMCEHTAILLLLLNVAALAWFFFCFSKNRIC